MKLNQDCVRDLLLYLENNLKYYDRLYAHDIKLKNYSSTELLYTTEKLEEANFLNCFGGRHSVHNLPLTIDSITYQGHQFLDTIRDNGIWKETKLKASKIASISLPILQELASQYIKIKLGLS